MRPAGRRTTGAWLHANQMPPGLAVSATATSMIHGMPPTTTRSDLYHRPRTPYSSSSMRPEVVLPDRAEPLRRGGLGVIEHRVVQRGDQVVAPVQPGQVGDTGDGCADGLLLRAARQAVELADELPERHVDPGADVAVDQRRERGQVVPVRRRRHRRRPLRPCLTCGFVKNAVFVVIGVAGLSLLNHADGGVRIYKRRAIRPPPGSTSSGRAAARSPRCPPCGRWRSLVGDDDIAEPVDRHPQLVAHASGLDDHRLGDTERVGMPSSVLKALPCAPRVGPR